VRVFGIDPGSERTGYGCVETDGSHHSIVACGAIGAPPSTAFPDRLLAIHRRLAALLRLPAVPAPHDAADALAVAICHVHSRPRGLVPRNHATSWRHYRPAR